VEHPDANYSGLYDPLEHCPGFAMDFTCAKPYEPAAPNPELHAREFRQVPASPVLAMRGYSHALYTTTSSWGTPSHHPQPRCCHALLLLRVVSLPYTPHRHASVVYPRVRCHPC